MEETEPEMKKKVLEFEIAFEEFLEKTEELARREELTDDAYQAEVKALAEDIVENTMQQARKIASQLQLAPSTPEAVADFDKELKFVEVFQRGELAVEVVPQNHPDRIKCLDNFGILLIERYLKEYDIRDVEKSIQLGRDVLHQISEVDSDRAHYLNNLSLRLAIRYGATSDPASLEEAIQLEEEAIEKVDDNQSERAMYLSNLGGLLRVKCSDVMMSMDDLEKAIRVT